MKFKSRKNQETSNFEARVIKAKIGNTAKMLKMFTKDLYKHPLQTSIQEYINNAKDAHTMIGKDFSTIEITAPTVANQNVIIRDYGPGLSPDDIENIFANIAVSNKDDSDKFNGGFGIGSKSWFAVNTSFMVVSNFNGVKTYYSVNFDESKGIFINVEHEEETEDANGVEVTLPLANKDQIEASHKAIFRAVEFWAVKPVLINCTHEFQEMKFTHKDYTLISDKVAKYSDPRIVVTLGGTPYSIKEMPCYYNLKNTFRFLNVAIHFEVGEMQLENVQEVGPDRESYALICSDKIKEKADKVYKQIVKRLTEKLDATFDIEEINQLMCNPILAKEYQGGYDKELKCGQIITFRPNPNRDGERQLDKLPMKIKGKFVDWINVNGKSSCAETYLGSVARVTHILIEDKEVKQTHLRLAIANFLPEVGKPSKYSTTYKGLYVVDEKEFSKKEIKELSKYFVIKKLSEIKYEVKKRAKLPKDEDVFNAMKVNWQRSNNSNIRVKFSELSEREGKVTYITKLMFDGLRNINWDKIVKGYRELNTTVLMVSETNRRKMEKQGYELFSYKKMEKGLAKKEKERVEKAKQELLKSGFVEQYKYFELVDFLRSNTNSYFMDYITRAKLDHPIFSQLKKLDLPDYWDLRRKRGSINDEMFNSLKIKQELEIKNTLVGWKKKSPLLFNILTRNLNNKDYHAEIKYLLERLK